MGIGLGAAWGMMRVFSTQLFGVEPADPATYAAVVGVLVIVACVAGYLPARRAGAVEPSRVLTMQQWTGRNPSVVVSVPVELAMARPADPDPAP